jgi:hypothetical protein
MKTLKVTDLKKVLEKASKSVSVYIGKTDNDYTLQNAVICPNNNTSDLVLFINYSKTKKSLTASDLKKALDNAQREGVETVLVCEDSDYGFYYRIRQVSIEKDNAVLFLDTTKRIKLYPM